MRMILGATALLAAASVAWASSEDAWAQHRTEVETACAALVEASPEQTVTIETNPFGSERFGVALITIAGPKAAAGSAPTDRLVCIMDKTTRAAEITAPFEQPR